MWIEVEVTATVSYVCNLNEEDTKKVCDCANEQGLTLREAVAELYADGEIDLYAYSTESDFSTESIDKAIKRRE
jgi:selenophosphate synthetase-related protein